VIVYQVPVLIIYQYLSLSSYQVLLQQSQEAYQVLEFLEMFLTHDATQPSPTRGSTKPMDNSAKRVLTYCICVCLCMYRTVSRLCTWPLRKTTSTLSDVCYSTPPTKHSLLRHLPLLTVVMLHPVRALSPCEAIRKINVIAEYKINITIRNTKKHRPKHNRTERRTLIIEIQQWLLLWKFFKSEKNITSIFYHLLYTIYFVVAVIIVVVDWW